MKYPWVYCYSHPYRDCEALLKQQWQRSPSHITFLPFTSSITIMSTTWQELVADKRKRQQESIPKDWFINVPPQDQLNVTDVPAQCGLLGDKELEITSESDVDVILAKLASGEWSSVEVTTAFYKRAIIAQQLVEILVHCHVSRLHSTICLSRSIALRKSSLRRLWPEPQSSMST